MSLADIADAANDLAQLLEASKPRGLRHPQHAKRIKAPRAAIKRVIVHYFERQRKAVLAAVEPRIKRELVLYPPQLKEASRTGKSFARELVPANLHPLTFAATAAEQSEYDDAIGSMISAAAESLASVAGEDLAGRYLGENSLSKLTGGLNQTSIERLQDALANAWDKGGTYDSMVSAITETFDDFSETRAGRIAQTEGNDAYNFGRRETADALDLDEKRWDADGEACEECQANADAGWIDIDEDFPSGDDAPTAHPGCDCGCDYRKAPPDEE